MALALFDLDDTLIKGNCETAWFEYLAQQGHIDSSNYKSKLLEFDRLYAEGAADIDEYMTYVLSTFTPHPLPLLHEWRADWLNSKVKPTIVKNAKNILTKHRDAGDTLVIISASNTFCVEAIANYFKVDHFIGTSAIMVDDYFTGDFKQPACYANHKVTLLNAWLKKSNKHLNDSHFYTDSHNDIPLLELVENPVAVDADKKLTLVSKQRGWKQISLR